MLKRNTQSFFFFFFEKEPLWVQNNIPKGVTRKTFRVRKEKKIFFTLVADRPSFVLMFYVCLLTQKIQIAVESDHSGKKRGLCFSCLEYLQQCGGSPACFAPLSNKPRDFDTRQIKGKALEGLLDLTEVSEPFLNSANWNFPSGGWPRSSDATARRDSWRAGTAANPEDDADNHFRMSSGHAFTVQATSRPRGRPGCCSSRSPSQRRGRREIWSPLLDASESVRLCILSQGLVTGHIPSTGRIRTDDLDWSPAVPFTNREPFMSARGDNLPQISTADCKSFQIWLLTIGQHKQPGSLKGMLFFWNK